MMKKIKSMLIIISLMIIFISCKVNAANGDIYTVSTGNYFDQTMTYNGAKAGGGYIFTLSGNGETLTAYCIDPLGDNPANGSRYKEISAAAAGRTSSAYQSVFEQTCGDDATRITALKSMAYNLGEISSKTNAIDPANGKNLADTIANVYGAAKSGDALYTSDIKDKINGVINDATNSAETGSLEAGAIELKEISNDNGKIIVYAYLNGNIVTDDSIECKGYSGESCTYSISDSIIAFTITKPDTCYGSFGAYIIIGYNSNGAIPGADEDGTGEGEDTTTTCGCTPRYFQNEDDPTTFQQLIACPSTGENPDEHDDINYPGFTDDEIPEGFENYAYGDFSGECSDSDINCEPFVEEFETNPTGQVICDENGKTVITFVEVGTYKTNDLDKETVESCIFDGFDYTNDNSIVASKLIFGKLKSIPKGKKLYSLDNICDVYCTEDYELTLPGPTAGTFISDNQVLINSGSFFTIDEKINDKTTVKCYGNLRYHVLVDLIDYYREKTIDAYNRYQEYLVVNENYTSVPIIDISECKLENEDGTCIVYDTDYGVLFTSSGIKYDTYTWIPGSGDNSGQIKKFGKATVTKLGTVEELSDVDDWVEEIREEYENAPNYLDNTANEAEESIKEAIDFWNNDCLGWKYDKINSEIYKKTECSADIGIEYYDEYYFLSDSEDIEIEPAGIPIIIGENNTPEIENKETKNISKGFCSSEGCSNTTEAIDDGDYNYSSETVTIKYDFKNTWCNPYDDSVKPYILESDTDYCNGTKFEGFPVSTETTSGLYSYTYSFDNFGHYFDTTTCQTGRINEVIDAGYAVSDEAYTNRCIYKVNNCNECLVRCTGINASPSSCNPNFMCNNNCKVSCVGGGCIMDIKAGFLATYRTVSLNSFAGTIAYQNPLYLKSLAISPGEYNTLIALVIPGLSSSEESSTKNYKGSNWKGAKADEVIQEINDKGENIYNDKPEYSFTLTPQLVSEIREYNKTHDYSTREADEAGEVKDGKYISNGDYAYWQSNFITQNEDLCKDIPSDCRKNVIRKNYSDYNSYEFTGPAKQ